MWPCGKGPGENSHIRFVTNRRAILAGLDLAGYGSYLSAPAGKPANKGFFGGVAQLVRASACHAEGRGFEPRRSRHPLQGWRFCLKNSSGSWFCRATEAILQASRVVSAAFVAPVSAGTQVRPVRAYDKCRL